eukprot:CAMPEP_0174960588 /NCGR_PEP_ID=MMETSP0004_2-20121128/3782_1 /TAXON_ID=420556 /ORGANISM="Ochromonas sp., Strain CCMP1393" /LENGTH=385 /DNA_ID=CAMNT_0016208967 /DNA_START=31 /DNA_END=1188 /DNA_ORIENTATION=+
MESVIVFIVPFLGFDDYLCTTRLNKKLRAACLEARSITYWNFYFLHSLFRRNGGSLEDSYASFSNPPCLTNEIFTNTLETIFGLTSSTATFQELIHLHAMYERLVTHLLNWGTNAGENFQSSSIGLQMVTPLEFIELRKLHKAAEFFSVHFEPIAITRQLNSPLRVVLYLYTLFISHAATQITNHRNNKIMTEGKNVEMDAYSRWVLLHDPRVQAIRDKNFSVRFFYSSWGAQPDGRTRPYRLRDTPTAYTVNFNDVLYYICGVSALDRQDTGGRALITTVCHNLPPLAAAEGGCTSAAIAVDEAPHSSSSSSSNLHHEQSVAAAAAAAALKQEQHQYLIAQAAQRDKDVEAMLMKMKEVSRIHVISGDREPTVSILGYASGETY